MAGGERPETGDNRYERLIDGLRSVRPLVRDEHEFARRQTAIPEDPPLAPPDEKVKTRLEEIGDLLRSLTYGEMIDLASELWHFREVGEINQDTLPAVFHGWATNRRK